MDELRYFLPPENVQVIVYHYPCMDGLGGAFVGSEYNRRQNIKLVPFSHGKMHDDFDLDLIKNLNVVVVDCCLDRGTFDLWSTCASRLCLIDHHISTIDEFFHHSTPSSKLIVRNNDCQTVVENLSPISSITDQIELFSIIDEKNSCSVHVEIEKSGCRLMWEYFFNNKRMPAFLKYLDDHDLGKYKLENSRAFIAAFQKLVPKTLEGYRKCLELDQLAHLFRMGIRIRSEIDIYIEHRMQRKDEVMYTMFEGHPCAVICCNKHVNEMAEYLLSPNQSNNLTILWFQVKGSQLFGENQPHVHVGLRCRDDCGLNVSVLAKIYNGGGHKFAAGFEYNGYNPYPLFDDNI